VILDQLCFNIQNKRRTNLNLNDLITDLKKSITLRYDDNKGIYLFGSRAGDKYNKDSDVDIVTLFDKVDREKKFEIYGIISDLMYKYDTFIDIKIMTPLELKSNQIFFYEVSKGVFYE
jgi:predicted nucleotidyltransferase